MKKQYGFTITELMVGLTLAMILAFAVGTVYTQTRQSFKLQTAQTRLVEQGRYAIAIFQKMATQAGYRNESNTVMTKAISDASLFNGLVINEASGATQFMFTGNAASSPSVIIRCDGTDYTTASVATNSLKKDGNKLVCSYEGPTVVDLLPDNVVDFKVTYGEDTNSDKIPDGYTTLASTPALNFKNVYAAKMCIVIRSDVINGNTLDSAQTYVGCSDDQERTATDHRLYRRFDTTVYLRNRFD